MKNYLLFFILVLSASFLYPQNEIVDDFEGGNLGHFNGSRPKLSGSTVGILDDPVSADSTTAFNGSWSLKFQLRDDPASSADWFVRFISGPPSASLATNDTLGATGWVGYALKVTGGNGLKCGIGMDAPGTAERSDSILVINDGQWHLYQWDLQDVNTWTGWVTGNGIIEEPVSIDAIWFYAPNGTADASLNMDYVVWNPSGQVPVELVSFNSTVTGNEVELRWITASETNNSGFEVQRKSGNNEFEKIGFVDGKGTTTAANIYSFTDKAPEAGKYFYRLKQIDFDGTFEYSNEIFVDVVITPGEYTLAQNYPNPFNPNTSITYNIPEAGEVTLSVFNLLGEKVTDLVNEFKENGTYTINFNASGLASGTYIYTLNVNGNSISKKMVLMK